MCLPLTSNLKTKSLVIHISTCLTKKDTNGWELEKIWRRDNNISKVLLNQGNKLGNLK